MFKAKHLSVFCFVFVAESCLHKTDVTWWILQILHLNLTETDETCRKSSLHVYKSLTSAANSIQNGCHSRLILLNAEIVLFQCGFTDVELIADIHSQHVIRVHDGIFRVWPKRLQLHPFSNNFSLKLWHEGRRVICIPSKMVMPLVSFCSELKWR